MAGYVNSFFEQYSSPVICGSSNSNVNPITGETTASPISDCALWVVVGVVILSIAFEKKHKTVTK